MSYISEGLVVPNTTRALPENEHRWFSAAQ
jgi:hypothetical protein